MPDLFLLSERPQRRLLRAKVLIADRDYDSNWFRAELALLSYCGPPASSVR